LEKILDYTSATKEPFDFIKSKRIMAIFLVYTLFFVLLDDWTDTDTHPAVISRIDKFINDLKIHDNDSSWLYLSCVLYALCKNNKIDIDDIVINNQKTFVLHLLKAMRKKT
jgi:hypothetical protein